MKISVIAIFYNSEQTVRKCIDSIAMQKYVDIEIIAVDDCSSDSTFYILNEYSNQLNFLKVIRHSENLGISEARNSGLKNVSGDCFFLIDGDDYLSSAEALHSLAKHFTPETDWVQGSYEKCNTNDKSLGLISFSDRTYKNYDDICSNFYQLNFYYTHNKLINSKYKTYHFKIGCYHEDRMWIASIFPSLKEIVSISKPTYRYVIHSGQTSSKSRSKKLYIDSGMHLMHIMTKCPDCWKSTIDTFQIVDIEKPLYLWMNDRTYRKNIIREINTINNVTTPTKGFPRFTRILHYLIQTGIPDTLINCISKAYVKSMQIINHPI